MTVLHLGEPSHRTAALDAPEAVGLLAAAALRTGGRSDLHRYRQLAWGLRLKLDVPERRALAWAALMALDMDDALDIAQLVIPPEDRAGWPVVPLEDVVEEAAFWADYASPEELRAYAVACVMHLPSSERRAFLDTVQGRAAA